MPLPQLFWRPRVMFNWTSSGFLRVNSMRHSPVIGARDWPLVTAAGARQKTNRIATRAILLSIGQISSASFQVSATARQKVSEKGVCEKHIQATLSKKCFTPAAVPPDVRKRSALPVQVNNR